MNRMRTGLGVMVGFAAALLLGFTITKTWVDEEVLTHTDLNNTFDEVETRLDAMDDCTNTQFLRGAGTNTTPVCSSVTPTQINQTSDYNFTGALINDGAGPTVDADGEIGHDTTSDQLLYGAGPNVLSPVYEQCAVVENLQAADDSIEVWMPAKAVTVTSVGCRCRGTCTTAATFTLEDRGGNGMTISGTNPTCATTGNSTYAAVTAANTLAAGEGMAFDVTNTPSPETDDYTLCWTYTITRD